MLGIGIAIGLILGAAVYKLIEYLVLRNKKIETPPLLRRGIVSKGYTSGSGASAESFSVQFEIGEIERTKDKSKVHVINMVPSGSSFADNLPGVRRIFDKSWVDSKDIEWIEKSTQAERKERLKDLLN